MKQPIRPPKRRKGKKRPNLFQDPSRSKSARDTTIARLPPRDHEKDPLLDTNGYPDLEEDYDWLEERPAPPLVRKTLHKLPTDIDPEFNVKFDETKHGDYIRQHLHLDHLPAARAARVEALVKKWFCVFNPEGLRWPVLGYEFDIDTGDHKPIAIKKINYGEREAKVMDKHIAVLVDLGQVEQVFESEWLFKALLAPKPHQESIYDIADFKWRFCVNFIPLNQITRLLAWPIPRCDNAISHEFGDSVFRWMYDCPQGYHQINATTDACKKLAFAAPNSRIFRYKVMPFGPVNGPTIFIQFIHDMNTDWQAIAHDKYGVTINDDTNTKIIVDDILSFSVHEDTAFKYMEAQLEVCARRRLSISLPKSFFFPERMEFVGVDVATRGNHPAMSKHELLQTWPKPQIIRDIASFIAFGLFYSRWIPFYEQKIGPFREICKLDYDVPVTSKMWTPEFEELWKWIIYSICSDPCLMRFDHRKRFYVRTDFCSHGFGFVGMQPDNDIISMSAMRREMAGGSCEFMKVGVPESPQLRPIALGSRRCKGRERYLHSYIGEGKAGWWGLRKCHHYMWGMRSTWCTDGSAITFILTYDGTNGPILRLQMGLNLMHVDIIHRNAKWIIDADYMSRHGGSLWFDPLLAEYDAFAFQQRKRFCPPMGPIVPSNMPDYRGPRNSNKPKSAVLYYGVVATINDELPTLPDNADSIIDDVLIEDDAELSVAFSTLHATIVDNHNNGFECLSVVPVYFERHIPTQAHPTIPHLNLSNGALPQVAYSSGRFSWICYGFNSGHFSAAIRSQVLPFDIIAAADSSSVGRAMFHEIDHCPRVFDSAHQLMSFIASANKFQVDGYLINSPRDLAYESHYAYWSLHLSIILECQRRRLLQVFVAHVHPSMANSVTNKFSKTLRENGWLLTTLDAAYYDFGDSIDGSSRFILGVHSHTQRNATKLFVPAPPHCVPLKLADFIYTDFNRPEYVVAYGQSAPAFSTEANSFRADEPIQLPSQQSTCLYNLVKKTDHSGFTNGCGVYSLSGIGPPLHPNNKNVFGRLFGIEFSYAFQAHQPPMTVVRPISNFEYACLFCLPPEITTKMSEPQCLPLLDGGIPALTSKAIFNIIYDRLISIRRENFQVVDYAPPAAPAALAHTYFSGAIGARLPNKQAWINAYSKDPECVQLRLLISNPALIGKKKELAKVHYIYRGPLRKSCLAIEDDFIVLKEPQAGGHSYVKLHVVPKHLYNIIFIAFHANPSGAHFGVNQTLSKIRIRYFWPNMYRYIKRMCACCAGCALANSTIRPSAELMQSFPLDGPMLVLHLDVYSIGSQISFDGDKQYLIAACGMTTFGVCEPISSANSTTLAQALMQIMLRFGMAHTIVLDRDSKFFATFKAVCELLVLNVHTLSSFNHDPMIVERINRFFNKGMKILCQERTSTKIGREGLLLLLYAWNSCPIPLTDISRSLLVTGREFQFPIDFSASTAIRLTSDKKWVLSYAAKQARVLKHSRSICKLMIDEVRAYHRERHNELIPDPRVYKPGDLVFARRAVQSKASIGRVDKVEFATTGPWRVTRRVEGGSYELQSTLNNTTTKRRASHISPVPPELVPYLPVDGADTRYGQIHRPISDEAFKNAGIKGFIPTLPFKSLFLQLHPAQSPIVFPTVAELNDELIEWRNGEKEALLEYDTSVETITSFAAKPTLHTRIIPSLTELNALLTRSQDRLFFLSLPLPSSTMSEWHLVRVAFEATLSTHPDCLRDGRFLVDFYILHPDDKSFNAPNQRYWLEYHEANTTVRADHTTSYHLIRPTSDSYVYAANQSLQPFRQWVTLLHDDVFLHGPFEFAILPSGRKSRDRISLGDWQVLSDLTHMFSNEPPRHDLQNLCSVHCSTLYHSKFISPQVDERVVAAPTLSCVCYTDLQH